MNKNFKQKKYFNCNVDNCSLLVLYRNNFSDSLYLYPYFLWHVLPHSQIFIFVGTKFFFGSNCFFRRGGTRPCSSIKPSQTNHLNSRIVNCKIICFTCVCKLFSLLLGNFLFENFLSVQVSIKICLLLFGNNSVKVWTLIWALKKSILFVSNSLKVSIWCDMNSKKFLL